MLVLLGEDEAAARCRFATSRAWSVLAARDAGVADVVGARTLVLSEAALDDLAGVAAEPDRER